MDDFEIKYIKETDLIHLIQMLKKQYKVTVDTEGKEFINIELGWEYKHGKLHLSMIPFLQKTLQQFDNIIQTKCQDSPYPHIKPTYITKSNLLPMMNL